MLREDCFQLPDFFAQPLTLCKCFFQSSSKITLILHESASVTTAIAQECSGLITENPSSLATSQSIPSAATK